MTIRDDLVTQVEQALKVADSVSATDYYKTLANAAVDAVAIYVYEQLASGS
jgi:hypothetical protein